MRTLTKAILATTVMVASTTAMADRHIHMSFIEATGADRQVSIDHNKHGYPTSADEITAILEGQGATIEARYGLNMPSESGETETIKRTSVYNVDGIVDKGLIYSIMTRDTDQAGYEVVYSIDHKGISDIVIEDGRMTPVIDNKSIADTIQVNGGNVSHTVTYEVTDIDDEGFFMPTQVYAVITITEE